MFLAHVQFARDAFLWKPTRPVSLGNLLVAFAKCCYPAILASYSLLADDEVRIFFCLLHNLPSNHPWLVGTIEDIGVRRTVTVESFWRRKSRHLQSSSTGERNLLRGANMEMM